LKKAPPDPFAGLPAADRLLAERIAELERTSHDWAEAFGTGLAPPLLERMRMLSVSIGLALEERGAPLEFGRVVYEARQGRLKALLPTE
jgi:hypothetical protein